MKSVLKLKPFVKPVTKTVLIPGSKSYTNRALILACLVSCKAVIRNPLLSDDTEAMIGCLRTLGIKISQTKNTLVVSGSIQQIESKSYNLNAKLSGTTIRFIAALATIIPGKKIIFGEEGLNKRPIGDLVDALRLLGADIEYKNKEGFPPIIVTSSKITESITTVNGNISSQFLSAVLMIAPVCGIKRIVIDGEQVSKSYVEMTLSIMKDFGVSVRNKDFREYTIPQNTYDACDYTVEGDFSGAAYFAAVAALTHSKITLQNLNPKSTQGDKEFLDILAKMGNKIRWEKNAVEIIGTGVKPVTVDMSNCPDQVQTLAVLAAFAQGKTVISGVETLKVKETNRLAAVMTELKKMRIKTETNGKSLTIFGGNPKSATIETYGDHRMAMSFAVAGTKISGIKIKNPEVVNKTFPDFWGKLEKIGGKIS